MTHFATLVLVPNPHIGLAPLPVVESVIDRLLAPYEEKDEWGGEGTRWDWYQIGGRFTGLLDGYDPTTDPANFETCRYCEGTGVTTQAVANEYPAYQDRVGMPCIQCNVGYDDIRQPFPGKMLRWNYQPHAGDIVPARELDIPKMRYMPSSVVTPDGEWHEQYRLGLFVSHLPKENGDADIDDESWRQRVIHLIDQHPDTIAVLVDCHV